MDLTLHAIFDDGRAVQAVLGLLGQRVGGSVVQTHHKQGGVDDPQRLGTAAGFAVGGFELLAGQVPHVTVFCVGKDTREKHVNTCTHRQ